MKSRRRPRPAIAEAGAFWSVVARTVTVAGSADRDYLGLFRPGDGGRTCFRIPALVQGPGKLFAFAESRTGAGDGCYPEHPVPGDGRTSIVVRWSSDDGASWSPGFTDICPSNASWSPAERRLKGCLDYSAVYDTTAGTLVVQYCQGETEAACVDMQILSTDMGATWSSVPKPLATALGEADGVLVGPGRGLQLRNAKHGKRGRLLFCGHKQDPVSGRLSPIWASDDHGESFELKVTLPRGKTSGALATHGPDECQFAELADGTVIYNARNNWWATPGIEPHRLISSSTDGGDTWSAVRYDEHLEGTSCQGSVVSTANLSNTLYFSHPLHPNRTVMVVRRSDNGGASWPHAQVIYNGGAAYSCLSPLADPQKIGLLFERDADSETPCTAASHSCFIAFSTFPAQF